MSFIKFKDGKEFKSYLTNNPEIDSNYESFARAVGKLKINKTINDTCRNYYIVSHAQNKYYFMYNGVHYLLVCRAHFNPYQHNDKYKTYNEKIQKLDEFLIERILYNAPEIRHERMAICFVGHINGEFGDNASFYVIGG